MSMSECERFSADLQSSEALRAEAEKVQASTSTEAPLARMVAVAVSKGYDVTLAEAQEHLKAKAAAAGQALSDAELDRVAGGNDLLQQYANHPAVRGISHNPLQL